MKSISQHFATVSGFSLMELLISLLLLFLMLLGFDAMQLTGLKKARDSYFLSVAESQLFSMSERLKNVHAESDQTQQIKLWNEENQELLPFGKGYVTSTVITIFWGQKTTSRICKKLLTQELKCLSIPIPRE